MIRTLVVISIVLLPAFLLAQNETVVTGRIYEKGQADVLPFVSIHFKGTNIGTTSDFDGKFSLHTTHDVDTLIISYVGYVTIRKAVRNGVSQHLLIEMESAASSLKEVVIRPGVNPALRIIREAQKRKVANSMDNLTAFEYDVYSKQDVSMNNISDRMKEQKMFAPIRKLFDTAYQMKNEDGKYILPVFISETYSRFYQKKNPYYTKDMITATHVVGFGAEKQSYITDIIGSSLMQFNFNQNWIRYLSKDFMSPIADGSMDYYLYTLMDSVMIEGRKSYKIRLDLKRSQDLGFTGTIWISDMDFALRRLDLELTKSANINFIDRFRIQQELTPTEAGPYIPTRTRSLIDISQLSENTTGFVARLYSYNSNMVVNQPKPDAFFDVPIEHVEDNEKSDTAFWTSKRPEPYTATESAMAGMIDSVRKLPAVKTYIDIFRLVLEGHYRAGKFDIGPYLLFIGFNEVEHVRLRFGFRTNRFFSDNWQLKGYLAYGFNDARFKYGMSVERIFSHKHWTTFGISTKNDLDILGITDASSQMMNSRGTGNLFAALSFAVPGSRMNRTLDYRAVFFTQPYRDWSFRITCNNTWFAPAGRFEFAHRLNPSNGDTASNLTQSFTSTAISADIRFAYREVMISRGVDRVRIARARFPAVTLSYSHGIKGLLNGKYNFEKLQLSIDQHVSTGTLGNADFRIICGRLFGTLPYPLLDVARGNATFIYSDANYGLMNLYEFVSDQYTHLSWVQHFEGLFTNRIPVLRNWHLRNFGFIKACYGHLSDANKQIIPTRMPWGRKPSPIYEFSNSPYVEAGFGFENIFRFIQLGYVRRLTYLNNVHVRSWGITVGVVLSF